MRTLADYLVPAVWLVGLVYWIAAAAGGTKKTRFVAPGWEQVPHHILSASAGVLLLVRFRSWPLGAAVLPRTAATAAAGLAILALGTGFACWARATLGRNWSAIVTLKEGHRLIRTGPYALARHPIYTGLIASVLGTAVTYGRVQHFVGFVLFAAAYWRKSRLEERWLATEFGAEYAAYRREVRALVPFVF